VNRETLFQRDYPYVTGINKGGIAHFKAFAEDILKKYCKKGDFVVDIGGNDGTLLRFFQDMGCKVLNVDPSDVVSKVTKYKHFWEITRAHYLLHDWGKANVILATNVFAHCDNLHDFLDGINILLDDNGVFIVESPCLTDMLKTYQFDQIYHEHLSYFDIYPMHYLVGMHDMYIDKVEHNEMHGGSNRYFIKRLCGKGAEKQANPAEVNYLSNIEGLQGSWGERECQGQHAS
jgi:hypothetical protein